MKKGYGFSKLLLLLKKSLCGLEDLFLSLFMTGVLKWKGGPKVQCEEWDEMKELQPDYHTAHTFSTGFWEHLFLTEKNPKQQPTAVALLGGERNPLWTISKF